MIRMKHAVASATLLAAIPLSAFAQTTQNVQVQVQVNQNCSVTAPSNATFAAQSPTGPTTILTSGSVRLTCNRGAAPLLAVNNGSNPSGTQRQMINGAGGFLNYAVKQPTLAGTDYTACPAVNGGTDWTGTTLNASAAFANSGGPRTVNVCFETTVDENTPVATYSDTVAVSFTF